ncbi:MAG: cytoplasmic iron level regulating protein YaaA (DUF328/UPF0246 family) [Candidatus Woesearchaeota archaeon]|jgi:cytoplasmic iron level regulating protein YaaA (DUF328/UPF0246 family)
METIILIPPSESKAVDGTSEPLQPVHPITALLHGQIKRTEPTKLYGLKGANLDEAICINQELLKTNTLPAMQRYIGVVYDAIDYPTLKNKELFDKRIRIVSALFGLVKPQDLIPNYRLKMDKLQADKLWLEENSKQLEKVFVIDLLPQSHKKALTYKDGISVEFVLTKNDKKMPAGHQGKQVKGKFIRWLIENDIQDQSKFADFKEDGYVWTGTEFLKND